MSDLLELAIYNPAILKDEDFLAGFVARHGLVDDILIPLQAITRRSLAKHRLILGQRGMGKTSLLRRIALGVREDPKLSQVLLPLTFREEQYNVHNLHTFWCNCLDALGDHFERTGQHEKAQALDQDVAALTRPSTDDKSQEDGEAALASLKGWAKREGKRPLLLLDNIDLILDGLTKHHWSLRRTLQEAGGIVVIGAASVYLEVTADPKGAFYDFFQVTVLERLGQDELLTCLRRLAKMRGIEGEKVLQVINADPARVRTLYDLTGSNPRTLVLLYLLLERDAVGDVMSDLERLLDQVTVLYKSRVEDLAPQARVVLDAMALAWNPVSAADLSTATGMETPAVSSQLDRMLKNGVVEKVSVSTTNRAAFQVGERFFNIWYLMRHGPRRQRSRLRWLTSFLRGFYSPLQLTEKATSLLKQQNNDNHAQVHYYLALSDAVDDGGLRNLLGQEARRELESVAEKLGKPLEELVDIDDLPTPQTAKDWFGVGWWLHTKLERFKEAEAAYRNAVNANPKLIAAWNNLGNVLTTHLAQHCEAEIAYRTAIESDPKHAFPWNNLGLVLTNHLDRHNEAEAAFRNAIDIDSKYAAPWCNLGLVLTDHLDRHNEADAAYRNAVEIDPKFTLAWLKLGDLLTKHLGRYEDAEAAYLHATKLGLNNNWTWCKLGYLQLYFLDKPADAELAYQFALQLEPNDLCAASNLLAIHLTQPNHQADVDAKFETIVTKHPSDGANLIRTIRSLARNNFGEACTALKDVLAGERESAFGSYDGFYLLVLRLAAKQGFGDKLLAWMDEQGLTDRYWPLRAAFDAYLHGEKRLMDVNPEVRGAAKHIYVMLNYPRRYREKLLAETALSEKPPKNVKPKSSRRVSQKTNP